MAERKRVRLIRMTTARYIVGCSEHTHWDYERIITDLFEMVKDERITTRVALRQALTDQVNAAPA